jgi:hypothetical protein
MPMDWGLARDYAARDMHTEETRVTEAEWLAATDPAPMLEHLDSRANDRKLRLFCCACCLPKCLLVSTTPYRAALGVAERYAVGLGVDSDVRLAQRDTAKAHWS